MGTPSDHLARAAENEQLAEELATAGNFRTGVSRTNSLCSWKLRTESCHRPETDLSLPNVLFPGLDIYVTAHA